jgi:hypothetical protein
MHGGESEIEHAASHRPLVDAWWVRPPTAQEIALTEPHLAVRPWLQGENGLGGLEFGRRCPWGSIDVEPLNLKSLRAAGPNDPTGVQCQDVEGVDGENLPAGSRLTSIQPGDATRCGSPHRSIGDLEEIDDQPVR